MKNPITKLVITADLMFSDYFEYDLDEVEEVRFGPYREPVNKSEAGLTINYHYTRENSSKNYGTISVCLKKATGEAVVECFAGSRCVIKYR